MRMASGLPIKFIQ